MDNRRIDITAEGVEDLGKALELIWRNAPGGKAVQFLEKKLEKVVDYFQNKESNISSHYSKLIESPTGVDTLILLWSENGKGVSLPYPLDINTVKPFVAGWLGTRNYGSQPDHDGSNGKGWRVFNEAWGHVFGNHYAICAIQPAWAMYGK